MAKYYLLLIGPLFLQSTQAYAQDDTARIYFSFNAYTLDKHSQTFLDSLVYSDYFQNGDEIFVLGYTDYVGSSGYNDSLSARRAEAVRAYLTASSSLNMNVRLCAGKGKIVHPDTKMEKGVARDRVVDIIATRKKKTKPAEVVWTVDIPLKTPPRTEAPPPPKYKGHHKEFIHFDINGPAADLFEEHNNAAEDDPIHGKTDATFKVGFDYMPLPARREMLQKSLARSKTSLIKAGYSHSALEMAMVYSYLGKKDSVFYFLNLALDSCKAIDKNCRETWDPNILGFYQFHPYLHSAEWDTFERKIVNAFKQRNTVKNYALAIKLIKAGGADQSIRWPITLGDTSLPRHQSEISAANELLIKSTIKKSGYPRISEVGEDASEAAFLLIQHSSDTNFQKAVLEQMEALVSSKKVALEDYAMLTDRYMVNTTGTQLYGTQFKTTGDTKGTKRYNELYPILEPADVNMRRKKMGLPALEVE